jgi:deoxyhypusine synthase
MGPISAFIESNYFHFNAASLKDAARGYKEHINKGGKMFVTLAGAMSTAELGISLAEMIRQDKIHGISCTGANLEEDVFNLVAHEHYVRVPNWRELSPDEEMDLLSRHLNRVTDTCIPEEEAIRRIEKPILAAWEKASKNGESYFPHEYFYQVLKSGDLKGSYQIDPKNSWMLAAAEKNLPIFVPGWEDSTLGNIFAGRMMQKKINRQCLKSGVDYMVALADWYTANINPQGIGFFQIAGGIAGDFPICVVPMLEQDLERDTPKWSYFCQISDSTTSYGSYSGAVPNEKITWGKLEKSSTRLIIESDASIVAPLIFAYVLGK